MTKKTTVLFLLAATIAAAVLAQRVEFILDGSGSMWGEAGGEAKIVAAKRTMKALVAGIELPAEATLGLTVYGHRSKGDCADIEHFPAVAYARRSRLAPLIEGVQPKGKTPIADSLRIVGESLRGTEMASSIVLVSDGIESCDKDPCDVARQLRQEYGIEVEIHVVGFDVREGQEQLECIAERGGGIFVTAENSAQLEVALAKVEAEVAEPASEPEAEPINVAAAANGGRIVLFSTEYHEVKHLIDGSQKFWSSRGAEPQSVVFGFRDDLPARIADLMINPQSDMNAERWAKSVEVFASDDSPWEGYRRVGATTLEPVGTLQVHTFEPPIQARYVKLRFLDNQNSGSSHITAAEVMMMGWLLDGPPPPPPLANLAAAAAGAEIQASSEYHAAARLIDGTQDGWSSRGVNPQDVTIRLAGDTARRIHLVAIDPRHDMGSERWAREVEVFTSESSPYKGFVSQGRLELPQLADYQVLRFPEPVTARYLRLRFHSNHGGSSHIAAAEVVALGE